MDTCVTGCFVVKFQIGGTRRNQPRDTTHHPPIHPPTGGGCSDAGGKGNEEGERERESRVEPRGANRSSRCTILCQSSSSMLTPNARLGSFRIHSYS